VLSIALVLGFTGPSLAQAATTPTLGVASTFGVLSSTFTNSNTAPQTIITGDIGYTVAGAPTTAPITVTGTLHPEDATFTSAGTDQGTALTALNTQSCTTITGPLDATVIGTNAAGTFPPGCYTMATPLIITLGTSIILDLTAPGGVGNTWIFKSTGGGLTTGADSFVTLAHGASACNVFWTPVAATNIGAYTGALPNTAKLFIGTIIDAAGINLGHFANLSGQALAFGGTVTTDANTITVPTCSPAPANLTVVKVVINDNGRTKVISDFPLFINGSPATSGISQSLTAGTFTVTETTDSNYTQTFSSNCPGGIISLAAGETKTCTITNDDIAAPAAVVQSSGGSSGGINYGCKDPTATNYNAFSSSRPELCTYSTTRIPPILSLVKVPTPLALPAGPGQVNYTYTLRNIGVVPVNTISVVDDKCSSVNYVSGDTNSDAKLDLNETWIYNCSTTLSQTTTNTATATGWANGISTTDIAIATVVVGVPGLPNTGVVPPLIHVTKVPSPLVLLIGWGLVNYTETVTNPGLVPLSNVVLTDDKCSPVNYVSGDLNNDGKLDPSESWVYTCQVMLNGTTTNTASVSGVANGFIAKDFAIVTVVGNVPGLPKTGFPPRWESMMWNIIIMAGIVILTSASVVVLKKRKI